MIPVAALYVDPRGVYARLSGVTPWGLPDRDARDIDPEGDGPPTVDHPPCAAWGRFSKPTPESTARGPLRGDDGGTFLHALRTVSHRGGVLEHPRDTAAWAHFGLPKPPPGGGWATSDGRHYVCAVEQGHYGHAARKPTWLLYVGSRPPFDLTWGPSTVTPRPWSGRRGVLECLSKKQRAATPPAFAAVLVALARWSTGGVP